MNVQVVSKNPDPRSGKYTVIDQFSIGVTVAELVDYTNKKSNLPDPMLIYRPGGGSVKDGCICLPLSSTKGDWFKMMTRARLSRY